MNKKRVSIRIHKPTYWNIIFLSLVILTGFTLTADKAFSRSAEEFCPAEKFDAVTVQGIYLGWQIPNSPDGTITVRLRESHVPLHIIASETRARHLFNRNYNALVEVTYDFIQNYSKEEEICRQYYVLKTGKIIQKSKNTAK